MGSKTVAVERMRTKGIWAAFVDDRPFRSDACYKHANVQSKAVFSYAMTVMDKICGWEDEEKWVCSNFAACTWIHTKVC